MASICCPVALLLLAPALLAGQQPRGIPVGETRPAPISLAHFGNPTDGYAQYSGLVDSARVVVRDAATWRRLWSEIHRPFIPAPAVPEIDFNREMVLLAAMGKRPSGGFAIVIEAVSADSARLVAQVTQVIPRKGCAVTAVITQPVDLVRVPAMAGPVAFTERVERTDCQPGRAPDRR